jgi:hypothetical protein
MVHTRKELLAGKGPPRVLFPIRIAARDVEHRQSSEFFGHGLTKVLIKDFLRAQEVIIYFAND